MKKKRLVPVLLLKNGWLVQSKQFKRFQNLGNPVTSVKRLSEWAADELIYLDISRNKNYDLRRNDIHNPNRNNFLDIINDVSKVALMPITVGGGIKNLNDIEIRLKKGADKISINTIALKKPKFISESAHEFGSQCIVVSIDVKKINNKYIVMSEYGLKPTCYNPVDWAKTVENFGAGEILLNSVDRDGVKNGYDIHLIKEVADCVKIPIIACGGVGEWSHFAEALTKTKVDAIAAANIFQYTDQSVYLAKKYLFENGFNVRSPDLILIDKK
ncbi:MAG: Imidazole glycerol phosphate synthase subunit [Candidatus Gottesmanbacteria bacterium GW2011_GWA1_34_13]|uniref:imidazole glycerol-phosphate synthase n=1 Tax=Candidatus Gottesmanbacteria bacterium GW2011_GWA1_34_13 TaxID=1618434 RepID=A0A0G0D9I0_9BACT|nr:MAG: Imidazole glycerol phosphate synthase subunit [Candidatus Gottesmanbacteria bacterium GW2011_GWA1_34_13]